MALPNIGQYLILYFYKPAAVLLRKIQAAEKLICSYI